MLQRKPKIEINKVYCGNALTVLKTFPDGFIDCCITSPPYYNLRDYGTANWIGGSNDCDHRYQKGGTNPITSSLQLGNKGTIFSMYEKECKKCGAIRQDDQIGLEDTPEKYVQKLVEVLAEVKRCLRTEGTLWLNLGDSYNGSGGDHKSSSKNDAGFQSNLLRGVKSRNICSLKPKDLIGIPWMVAFALRSDGWYLRNDIIWHKPNPMPESTTDRCTKSHEYIFLLAKSHKYYFDGDAIKEKASMNRWGGHKSININNSKDQNNIFKGLTSERDMMPENRNKRDVWTVNTVPYEEAHFATFPVNLIIPMIKAGCPKGGLILDPFYGSGTVGFTARQYDRNFIGIELNPEYVKIADERRKSLGIFK